MSKQAPSPREVDPVRPLAGMVVVLTGASAGLGVQFAHALDRAGASVVLAARREERLAEVAAKLSDALPVRCDVTVEDDRVALFAAAVERYGRVNALVNNAGAINVIPPMDEPLESIRNVVEINLIAPYAMAQHAGRLMADGDGGAIVNIASLAVASQYPRVPQTSYVAAKSGLVGLTRELAAQWAHLGIRVNALAPGMFRSEITQAAFDDPSPDSIVRHFLDRTPYGRPGEPGELDSTLLYLLDPRSSFVTGQCVIVDGGLTLE